MKNYIKYYGNSYPDRITQDDIKLYIDTEEKLGLAKEIRRKFDDEDRIVKMNLCFVSVNL